MDTPKITLEQFNEVMSYARFSPNTPKKIKVAYDFYQYLVAKCNEDVVFKKDDSPRGCYFTGIPIEIDNDLFGYAYEVVY